MSSKINKKLLQTKDILKLKNNCIVEGYNTDYGPAEKVLAYGETNNSLYIPFAYSKKLYKEFPNKGNEFLKSRYSFKSKEFPFRTDGGRDQEEVFNKSIKILEDHRSLLLSLFCGFGKCLAYNTGVLMFDGSIKKVQDIRIGDIVMGDDSRKRVVSNINSGIEEMYEIEQKYGQNYVVNKSHILSLKIDPFIQNNIQKELLGSHPSGIVDISVENYFKLQKNNVYEKLPLLGYIKAIDFPEKNVNTYPYEYGKMLGENKISNIHNDYKINSLSNRMQLILGYVSVSSFINVQPKIINDMIFILRSLGINARKDMNNINISSNDTTPIKINYKNINRYYGFTIGNNHRFVLEDFTITHNTYTGLRLSQYLGLKTAVFVHRSILFDQWIEAIEKFTTAKYQIVGTNGNLDPDVDIYIFNIAFVHKKWEKETKRWVMKKVGCYKEIGILIIDEAHIACAKEMSRSLLYINPLYAIALTATPLRKDGMDTLLNLYFGTYKDTQIIRKSENPFLVYKLNTNIKPEYKTNSLGKKDWNSVISSLVGNKERNDIIINLIKKFSEYNILVLTKRIEHCKVLSNLLKEENIDNTMMVGTNKSYDKLSKVLLSTYSKLGVGFDDSKLNMLIVACTVTEIEQYAGRLRDGIGKKRIIIDLIDDDYNCKHHWSERKKWYLSRKGFIKDYEKEFKEIIEEKTDKPKRLVKRI